MTNAKLAVLSGVVLSLLSLATAADKRKISSTTEALLYLSRYGYIDPSATNPRTAALLSEEAVRKAILEFQAFANLNMTGEMDEETVKMMNMPRCGVRDKVGFGTTARRRKRYALQGSRWKVKDLNYQITKYPFDLTESEVDNIIKKSLGVWSEVTDLKFSQVRSGKVHIDIRFVSGEHGDGDPFDGPGGTLAHAFFPIYGGDVHLDSSEPWTIGTYRGTNFFQVIAHELGHSLGLSHSDVQASLMAPFYRGYDPTFTLHRDDIKAIQSLYGKKTGGGDEIEKEQTGSSVPPVRPQPDAKICSNPTIDAVVTMTDQKTYAFKGSEYYQLLEEGVADGYPRVIATDFDGLPSDLDAAFTWTNGKTYFFKGDKYWRFTDMAMDESYPKVISKGFKGIPDSVDAVFVWSGNGKIYFFKGKEYWRFDPTQRPPVKESYPKPISNWEGIPDSIDDALQYSNGYTYFFKDGQYWRFNDRAFKVDSAEPPFPRPVGPWWFGCGNSGEVRKILKDTGKGRSSSDDVGGEDGFDAGKIQI